MTHKVFNLLFGEALVEADRERFISEWATSSVFDADPDGPDPNYDSIVKDLDNIWWVAHLSIPDIKAHTGMTTAALAERFCIPVRTVENWASGQRSAPGYVRLMIADLLGHVTVERET